MELKNPDIRYLYDIKDLLYDQEWLKGADNFELYYMYRNLKKEDGLRYDITVIPARMLGSEFTKTKGHYHPGNFGELYTVLSGKAFYLMQKIDDNGNLQDIYAVEAQQGESVIIPPKYGHITINHGQEELKMANWVSDDFQSIYEPIAEMRGGAYFLLESGWVKNNNYKEIPELRIEKARTSIPEDLSFLKG